MPYRHNPTTVREGYHKKPRSTVATGANLPALFASEVPGLETLLAAVNAEEGADGSPVPHSIYGHASGNGGCRDGPCLVYRPVRINGSEQVNTNKTPAYYVLDIEATRTLSPYVDKEELKRAPMTKIRSDFFFPSQ